MHINVAICDDEVLQVKINGMYLKEIAAKNDIDLTVTGFTTFNSLVSFLNTNPVDIVFMDIDLGDTSGIKGAIELFKERPDLIVIFVTGHREFAYEAFDMDAMGYILKPIEMGKLEYTLLKAIAQIESRTQNQANTYHTFMIDKNNVKIAEHEILSASRNQSHVLLTTENGEYRIYDSITNLAEKLGNSFIRISQSELVNLSEIEDIRGYSLYTKHGTEMTISRKLRKEVLQAFFND